MTPIGPLMTQFLREHLPNNRGFSLNTCETYAHGFKLFFEYAAKSLSKQPSQIFLEELTAHLVLDFLKDLEVNRKNSIKTRNARLASIKSFMKFVEFKVPSALEQTAQILAIVSKRYDKPLIKHLNMKEVKVILNAPDVTTKSGIRDRAMIHLCFAGGLRVSELVGLTIDQLELGKSSSVHVIGKGRKERHLPLWKETAKDLKAWLAVRGKVKTQEVFLNSKEDAMSRSGFEYILEKYVKKASLTQTSLKNRVVTPHQLRHSCALVMLQATKDVRKVSLWLGHSDIRTTEMYLRVDPTEKLEAVEAVVPPSLRKGKFKAPDALIASLTQ